MGLFDIGQDIGSVGQVKQVKILGGLAVVDDNETDWKMLGIDMKDPLEPLVNSVADVERYRPGTTEAFYDWFAGLEAEKAPIVGDEYQDLAFCIEKVEESHTFWTDLVNGKADPGEIETAQTSNAVLKSYTNCKRATKTFDLPKKSKASRPAEKPVKFDGWFYYSNEGKLLHPEEQEE